VSVSRKTGEKGSMIGLESTPDPLLGTVLKLRLAVGHFLSHVEQQSPVALFDAAQEPAETAQITRVFPCATPGDIIRALPLWQIGELGWFFAVVEHLVERHFHGARELLKSLDRRNGMAVFDAGNVATKQAGALFDVALGKFLCFTE
jgi:hypothetical protein